MKYLKAIVCGPLLTGLFASFWHYQDALQGMDVTLYGLFLAAATGVIYMVPNKI